ncbi:hypothetical protein ACN2XU_22115 [Primorskyibacter sp. 2E107]|uniref:hypothetical protein n=1 Tax=Primorskyibacter sp. 2E107 TaxID=3403458 RepID=UPI003AF8EC57
MSMLLVYILLPMLLVPLIRFRPMRMLLGFKDIRKGQPRRRNLADDTGGDVRTIYHFGSRSKPKVFGDLALFEATAGARYLPPLLIVWIIILMFKMDQVESMADWVSFAILLAASIYLCTINWKTRIVLDGSTLHKTDWLFRHQTYDLADLTHAEQDASESYRLEFEDGRSAFILRWIRGHDDLKDLFIHSLEINGR